MAILWRDESVMNWQGECARSIGVRKSRSFGRVGLAILWRAESDDGLAESVWRSLDVSEVAVNWQGACDNK